MSGLIIIILGPSLLIVHDSESCGVHQGQSTCSAGDHLRTSFVQTFQPGSAAVIEWTSTQSTMKPSFFARKREAAIVHNEEATRPSKRRVSNSLADVVHMDYFVSEPPKAISHLICHVLSSQDQNSHMPLMQVMGCKSYSVLLPYQSLMEFLKVCMESWL